MTESEKFNVTVATFEAFLKKINAHAIYFQEWEEQNNYKGSTNVFYAWREWAKNFSPSLWINSAFTWRVTDRGLDYWHTLHIAWKKYIKDHLNK